MDHIITCSWCHAVNRLGERWCKVCGHSALLPRHECDCIACVGMYSPQSVQDPRTNPIAGDPTAAIREKDELRP